MFDEKIIYSLAMSQMKTRSEMDRWFGHINLKGLPKMMIGNNHRKKGYRIDGLLKYLGEVSR